MPDAPATTPLASRSPQTVLVDNVLRRELRLSDPNDPAQISAALLNLYPTVSDQMARERAGFSYSDAPSLAPVVPQQGGATSAEVGQARDDLERDCTTMTTSSELKDVQIELSGWARAVQQATTDGLAAGQLSLDMVQFDRAISARRTLEDYARLARYVGAMSGDTSPYFRHFAQSCDVMGGLILVSMGEGMAASGVTRGSSMIRVSAGDLQSRRNAVIYSLRNLIGSVEAPPADGGWPRGPEAYRHLVRHLEISGQTDLRTLLDEAALAGSLDQLVDLAVGATSAGLRELSTASAMLVQRLQQLVQYGQTVPATYSAMTGRPTPGGTPESPPLVGFISALQLFIDAFTLASTGRLLYLARPPMVTYGLYGMTGPDEATQRLIQLAVWRGQLAEQVDFFADTASDDASALSTVLLDLVLYRVDRAIDFYAVGVNPLGRGDAEIRAAATGVLINSLLWQPQLLPPPGVLPQVQPPPPPRLPPAALRAPGAITVGIWNSLVQLDLLLLQGLMAPNAPLALVNNQVPLPNPPNLAQAPAIMVQELQAQFQAEQQIDRIVRALSPSGRVEGALNYQNRFWGGRNHQVSVAQDALFAALATQQGAPPLPATVLLPPTIESSVGNIAFQIPAMVTPTWP